ncbi:MAG: CRISPR-associated protein Csx19 [Calditrichaceae bacterium]
MKKIMNKIAGEKQKLSVAEAGKKLLNTFNKAYGIIESTEKPFWIEISQGQMRALEEPADKLTNPENWLSGRIFDETREVRLVVNGESVEWMEIADGDLGKDNYIDTQWLLAGGDKKVTEKDVRLMGEFQISPYRIPDTGGDRAPVLKVRQYIDYDEDGLARIVAERFTGLGEEN